MLSSITVYSKREVELDSDSPLRTTIQVRSLIEAFLQGKEAASKYPQPDLLQGYIARRHSFIGGHVSP